MDKIGLTTHSACSVWLLLGTTRFYFYDSFFLPVVTASACPFEMFYHWIVAAPLNLKIKRSASPPWRLRKASDDCRGSEMQRAVEVNVQLYRSQKLLPNVIPGAVMA